MYKTIFEIEHDNNPLCCNNYFYKCNNSRYNISYVNIHNIIKNHFLNYLTIPKYQMLLVDLVLVNELRNKIIKLFFFQSNIACNLFKDIEKFMYN